MSLKQMFLLVAGVLVVVVMATLSGSLLEFNENGQYQILQSVSGTLTVVSTPGPYWQGMGTVTTYPNADTIHFSKNEEGADPWPEVRFADASKANVSGFVQYSMPTTDEQRLALHKTYRSYENFRNSVIRRMYPAALASAASVMKAEESYSSRRSEFRSSSEEQLEHGLFETVSEELKLKDAEGNEFMERVTKIRLDPNGRPVIPQESPLKTFGVQVMALTLNDIDFDPTVDALIAKKKEAEQQRVVARANAERAKQDAITAEEQGKAKVAVARAEKEVEKIEAVTAAEKEFRVAELNKQRDQQNAEAALIKARAEAEGNRLKVAAGLTPLERANIAKETAIGVAQALSHAEFPKVFVTGNANSSTNPLEAMGFEAMYNLSKKMAQEQPNSTPAPAQVTPPKK